MTSIGDCIFFVFLFLLWGTSFAKEVIHDQGDSSKLSENLLANVMAPRIPHCPHSVGPDINSDIAQNRSKILVCSMFRDERGFLEEYVSFYKVQGVDQVILFDHYSTDNSTDEIKPWIDSGFVIVHNASILEENNPDIKPSTSNYWRVIAMKRKGEHLCMQWGLDNGFDYHISSDIDEYVYPLHSNATLRGALDKWFSMSHLHVLYVPKFNFNPSPHFLEPIDLLTIEAYQIRYPIPGRINYYMTIQPKVIYRLSGLEALSNESIPFITNCCGFHGCELRKKSSQFDCLSGAMAVGSSFNFHAPSRNFVKHSVKSPIRMNHYARSLEKFTLKQKTWMSASQHSNEYDMMSFFHRTYGWIHDSSALRFSCLIRHEISQTYSNISNHHHQQVAQTKHSKFSKSNGRLKEGLLTTSDESKNRRVSFLRAGDDWYRNPEFGRTISDGEKRGRGQGRLHVRPPKNPLHYTDVEKAMLKLEGN